MPDASLVWRAADVRIMPPVTDPSSALGKSWRHSLRVETREQAEAALAALGSAWEWLPGQMLRTVTKPQAALLTEARSGREVFFTAAESTFNQLADEAIGAAADATSAPLRPLKAITYGDGAQLDAATKTALRDVASFMVRAQVAVPWQPGDALLCAARTHRHHHTHTPPPHSPLPLHTHPRLTPPCLHPAPCPWLRAHRTRPTVRVCGVCVRCVCAMCDAGSTTRRCSTAAKTSRRRAASLRRLWAPSPNQMRASCARRPIARPRRAQLLSHLRLPWTRSATLSYARCQTEATTHSRGCLEPLSRDYHKTPTFLP